MRRTVAIASVSAALGAIAGGSVVVWRRNPRVGTAFVNSTVNPFLVRRGFAGGGASEIGTLEHVGRRSGVRRLTPVHPEPTQEGFRVIVPLGPKSEWARNVLASGHCRLQLHDVVYELDEPMMISASDAEDLPAVARRIIAAMGFRYLRMRTFDSRPGMLEPAADQQPASDQPSLPEAARESGSEPVPSAR